MNTTLIQNTYGPAHLRAGELPHQATSQPQRLPRRGSILALAAGLAVLIGLCAHRADAAMPTPFTYQGRLNDAAGPANGNHDFEFRLADAPSNSLPFVSQTHYAVPVSNGVFTATPDFGSGYFNGDARWLEVAVRVTSSGSNFTTLLPRTPLTPTPYALFAARAGTADVATSATGLSLPLNINQANGNPLIQIANPAGPAIWAESANATALSAVNAGPGSALYAANAGGGPSAIFVGGNVGIGTQTPGEKLSVNGVIESKQGGVKFPDGTIQTTALQPPEAQVWSLNEQNDAYRSGGKVGIGTSLPEAALHLSEPVDQALRMRVQTARLTAGAMQKPALFPAGIRAELSGQPWSSLDSALQSDDQRSVVNLSASEGGLDFKNSQTLVLTNLGFALPSNTVIAFVEVKLEARGTATSATADDVQVWCESRLVQGNTTGSDFRHSGRLWNTDDVRESQATPGAWGLPLTPAMVNQSDFGVKIIAKLQTYIQVGNDWYPSDQAASGEVQIDSVAIAVHYYDPTGTTTPVNFLLGVAETNQTLRLLPGGDFTNASGLHVSTNGALGIGAEARYDIPLFPVLPPNLQLDVNGSARVHGDLRCTGSIYNGNGIIGISTRRYKQEIQPLQNSLALVQKLKGVSYRWDSGHGGKPDIGFIAEEVGKVVPEIVEYEPDGVNAVGLKYDRINALTVEAIKELHAAMVAKDAQLAELIREVNAMKQSRHANQP